MRDDLSLRLGVVLMSHHSQNQNTILKHVLADAFMRSKLITSLEDLDILLNDTVPKIIQATTRKDQYLTEKEVSARYPFLTVKQLQNWRYRHQGIKYIKTGNARNSRILYRVSDIEAFLHEHEQNEPYIESVKSENP